MNTTSLESGAARRQAVRPAPWADVLTRRTEAFWASTYYFPTMVLLTAAGLLTGHVVWGAAALIMVCAWLLAFCSDFMAAICPFMMIFPLATLEYKNLYVFAPCVPLVFFLIAGFLVHMVRWPLTIEVGPSGRGLTLTALAVTLGGLGTISAVDYLSLTSLYYVGSLGIGMLVAYVVVYSAMSGIHVRILQEFTVRLLYTLGFAMVLTVVAFYMQNWHLLLQSRTIPELIYRNFVATILVTTLPAVFYMARSGRRHLLSVGLWALAMFFSGSRSALLFGGVMLLLGLVWLVRQGTLPRWTLWVLAGGCAAVGALFGDSLLQLFIGGRNTAGFIDPNESRWRLLQRGLGDFLQHPMFGIGLGSNQNRDLYKGVAGSFCAYHNAIVQVAGSMGLTGLLTYGALVRDRVRLLRQHRDAFTEMVALAYGGMLMISMTNPGVFCPFPNAFLVVFLFAAAERASQEEAIRLPEMAWREGAFFRA